MKKAIAILFIILCLLSALPLINREKSVKASPTTRTWTVDDNGPADFDNIQEAINNASSDDTVFVHIGTYYEHVVINKTITLVGEDNNFTIIDGNETNNVICIRANNVTVKSFTVRKSGMYPYSGILVDHSTGNVIINNKVIYNYEGISLLYSSSNVVCGNTISSNYDGIYLYSSSNNVVSGNTIFSSNYDGIYLYYSSNNVVSSNILLHNDFNGISLYYSSSNVICGNTVLNNYYGIISFYSNSNNTIYHNNLNNTHQVWGDFVNFWDHDGEGNYWSDYSGQDLNRDGLGDVPYLIDETYQDNHPLMGAFSDFDVSLEGETYDVTVISNSTISTFKFEIGRETRNRIIRFNATGEDDAAGFCRVRIPTKLMNYSHIVLIDGEEIIPTLLNVSNETYSYLYFTYLHKTNAITIIYSEALHLYDELLNRYLKLQMDLYDLNKTFNLLSSDYGVLSYNYSQLQTSFLGLNDAYQTHLADYSFLLGNYGVLSYNYSQLQTSFLGLNDAYREHLMEYSEQVQNLRNLTYILAAVTAIFIMTTIYLSKIAHARVTARTKATEEK